MKQKLFKKIDMEQLYKHGKAYSAHLNPENKLVKAASFLTPPDRANVYRAPTVSLQDDPFLDQIFNDFVDATAAHWPNIQLNPQVLQSTSAGGTITADAGITGSDRSFTPVQMVYARDFEIHDIQTLTFDGDNQAGLDAIVAIDIEHSKLRTAFQATSSVTVNGWPEEALSLERAGLITSGTLTGSVDPLNTQAALESGSTAMSVTMKQLREQGGLDVICGYPFWDAEFIRRRDEAAAGGTLQVLDADGILRYRNMALKPHRYMPNSQILFTPISNLGIVTVRESGQSSKFFEARVGQGGTMEITVFSRQAYGFLDVNIVFLFEVSALNLS